MGADIAEEPHCPFTERVRARALDDLRPLYGPHPLLLSRPDHPATGAAAIGDILGGGWAPDGSAVELPAQTSDGTRRQADGAWRRGIDDPQGGAGVGAPG